MSPTVDVLGLVADGLLDLDEVFRRRADWHRDGDIVATHTARVYGPEGCDPGECVVAVQAATVHGITAYRWADGDDGGWYEYGPVTLSRDEAVEAAEEYARDQDDPSDEGAAR